MSRDTFLPLLKKAHLKVTKPRLLVLSLLKKNKHPINIKEIIKSSTVKIDQVTLYRVLEDLKSDGIVRQIYFQESCAYFELKDDASDHHHIVCTQCKKGKDFMGCQSEKLADKVLFRTPAFAKITNHSFEFFGICNACANK